MTKETKRIDCTAITDRAKQNIRDKEALAWLASHNIPEKTAESMGLGFISAQDHPELKGILEEFLKRNGRPGDFSGSYIIVPYGPGYFIGISTDPDQEASIMGRYYRPPFGVPAIWNDTEICTSDGAPIIVTTDLEDAIAFRMAGASAMSIMGASSDTLADLARSRHVSGPIVLIGSDAGESKRMAPTLEVLASKGLAALAYPFSGEGEDGFRGAMNTWREDPEGLRRIVASIERWSAGEAQAAASDYLRSSMVGYVDEFRKIIASRGGDQAIATGLEGLDKILDGGLYPGLYVMGAMSSLGKTTMALQIADYIAMSGRDVLFFTLEQSKEELMAKSVSRMTADQFGSGEGSTSRYILYKAYEWMGTSEGERIGQAIDAYASAVAPNMYFIEDDQDRAGDIPEGKEAELKYSADYRIGLDTIRRQIGRHIRATGRYPVVFVDYLQIIRPEDETGRKTDKQNLDETISELRRLSKAQHIPIFAISSFNRDHYDQEAGFGSFNGTSSIEYSADVLIGLQPRIIPDPSAKKKKAEPEDDGQDREVRDVTLRILKNRIGAKGSVPMIFNARYGLFMEDDGQERPEDKTGWEQFAG